jgi:hypothetical protein
MINIFMEAKIMKTKNQHNPTLKHIIFFSRYKNMNFDDKYIHGSITNEKEKSKRTQH